MGFTRRAPLSLALVAFAAGCGGEASPPRGRALARPLAEGAVAALDPTVRRAIRLEVHGELDAALARPGGFGRRAKVEVALFDDARFTVVLDGVARGRSGRVWRGRVSGHPDSEALVSSHGGRVVADLRVGGRHFEIRPTPDGGHEGREVDLHVVPSELPPIAVPQHEPSRHGPGGSDDTRVDVLVAYSAQAASAAGGHEAMDAHVDLAVAQANAGYAASGIPLRLRLVHTMQVELDESALDWEGTLLRLAEPDDGRLDEVAAARDAWGADAVSLVVENHDAGTGLAFTMIRGGEAVFAKWAYSMVARVNLTAKLTYAHELGHNFGAGHDAAHAAPSYDDYAFGLRRPERGYRTVMAYSCDAASCPRVNRWSSPDVVHGGVPTGVAGSSDNARALRTTAATVAAFRPTAVVPYDDVASLLQPAPGSAVAPWTKALRFAWNDAGADAYHLQVGSAPGGAEYYDAAVGSARGATVRTVPAHAEAIHVRLWSHSPSAGWFFRDYRYVSQRRPTFEGPPHAVPTSF